MTSADLIAFETRIRDLYDAGELPFLLHLAGGNESQLISVYENIKEGDWVFASHRCHYHALLKGIPPLAVEAAIKEGKSMFIYDAARNFCCSAILGGTCGIAAGVAYALKEEGSESRVWCFLGDGAEDNGHLWEAALYAEGHNLPVTFIIEDNGRQVETTTEERRGRHTKGLEWLFACVRRYYYNPTHSHAGSGNPEPTYNPAVVKIHAYD